MGKENHMDKVLEILDFLEHHEIIDGDMKSVAMDKIVKKLIERNKLDKALAVAEKIPSTITRVASIKLLINKLIEKDLLIQALALTINIEKGASCYYGKEGHHKSFSILISKLVEKNQLQEVLAIINRSLDVNLKSEMQLTVVKELVDRDQLAKALLLAGQIPDAMKKSEAIVAIIKKQVADHQLEKIEIAIEMAKTLSHSYKDSADTFIIRSQILATYSLIYQGRFDDALTVVVEKMHIKHFQSAQYDLLDTIITNLDRRGETGKVDAVQREKLRQQKLYEEFIRTKK